MGADRAAGDPGPNVSCGIAAPALFSSARGRAHPVPDLLSTKRGWAAVSSDANHAWITAAYPDATTPMEASLDDDGRPRYPVRPAHRQIRPRFPRQVATGRLSDRRSSAPDRRTTLSRPAGSENSTKRGLSGRAGVRPRGCLDVWAARALARVGVRPLGRSGTVSPNLVVAASGAVGDLVRIAQKIHHDPSPISDGVWRARSQLAQQRPHGAPASRPPAHSDPNDPSTLTAAGVYDPSGVVSDPRTETVAHADNTNHVDQRTM